jgi:hypothetical protein
MKLSKLLASRQSILRQAHLANLGQAYFTLRQLGDRVASARLCGRVRLQPADPREERYAAALTALTGSQARIEEHFSDEELMLLADAVALAIEAEFAEIEFNLEELDARFAAPLRVALEHAGVILDFEDHKQPNVAAENSDTEL